MKAINTVLYMIRIFFEMAYCMLAALLITLPTYLLISVISFILYTPKTRQQQHEKN